MLFLYHRPPLRSRIRTAWKVLRGHDLLREAMEMQQTAFSSSAKLTFTSKK